MVRQRLDLMKNIGGSNPASISTYKLIFMDFSMPDLDGIQTSLNIYQIHRDHGIDPFDPQHGTEICFISAYTDSSYVQKTKDIGVKHYIPKPATHESIVNLFRELQFMQGVSQNNDLQGVNVGHF